MSDTTFSSHGQTRQPVASAAACMIAMLGLGGALVSEWCRRSRSRWELALYSHQERGDLGFAAELDSEISKPFWRK